MNFNLISWILRLIVAAILFQTLYFKFTAAPESVWIFTQLGIEPWGRLASGIAELGCVVLLLWPKTVAFGAVGALGVISGAIFFGEKAIGFTGGQHNLIGSVLHIGDRDSGKLVAGENVVGNVGFKWCLGFAVQISEQGAGLEHILGILAEVFGQDIGDNFGEAM